MPRFIVFSFSVFVFVFLSNQALPKPSVKINLMLPQSPMTKTAFSEFAQQLIKPCVSLVSLDFLQNDKLSLNS